MRYFLAIEGLIRIIYFSVVLRKTNFKRLIENSQKSHAFTSKKVDCDELLKSFQLLRKILNYLLLDNTCLMTALSYFSMAPQNSKMHIHANSLDSEFEAHAWVELPDHQIITTDLQKTRSNSFVFQKI
ncbi:MAG: lasso peptide biosynthesis protein [Bdellovibrionaceae bacterium]|nr:lasso peptide biosynthesis protein [Pseudobdellovibrionaceae bacterium]